MEVSIRHRNGKCIVISQIYEHKKIKQFFYHFIQRYYFSNCDHIVKIKLNVCDISSTTVVKVCSQYYALEANELINHNMHNKLT
jgi:hypothetical protein